MAGEDLMREAAAAVHEIVGDGMLFAIVAWVPGLADDAECVAFGARAEAAEEAPAALATAAAIIAGGDFAKLEGASVQ